MVKNFVSIGEPMIELTHESDSSMRLAIAGDTLNTAIHLSRLIGEGLQISYVTALGDDWYGDRVIEELVQERVEPVVRRVDGGVVGLYLVRTDSVGERSFTYYRSTSAATRMYGADWPTELDEVVRSADMIYYSAITLQILSPVQRNRLWVLIESAREGGANVFFDPNYRPKSWATIADYRRVVDRSILGADVVLPTLQDEQLISAGVSVDGVVEYYLSRGAGSVVVKNGANPTTVATAETHSTVAVETVVPATDTTGAGDSFNAGYLAARIRGWGQQEAVLMGHRLAALVVQHRGGVPARNEMPELESLVVQLLDPPATN